MANGGGGVSIMICSRIVQGVNMFSVAFVAWTIWSRPLQYLQIIFTTVNTVSLGI